MSERPEVPKHCWVSDERWPGRLPALLLRWELRDGRWQALVVYAVPRPDAIEQRWLEAAALTPA
jgi:hypothetical protein